MVSSFPHQSTAQNQYSDLYMASDAYITKIQSDTESRYVITGATVLFPDASDQLNLLLKIPDTITGKISDPNDSIEDQLMLNLKIPVNRNEIQKNLTSEREFTSHGNLQLNNTSKNISIKYIPFPAGTDLSGDFDIYIRIRFRPSDFGINPADPTSELLIEIKRAKVNRI